MKVICYSVLDGNLSKLNTDGGSMLLGKRTLSFSNSVLIILECVLFIHCETFSPWPNVLL